MNKFSVELDRQLEIMAKYQLSAEEWFFVQLLFLASEPESKPQYLHTYFRDCKKSMIPKQMLSLLKEKKILSNSYVIPKEGDTFDIRQLSFDDKFTSNYLKYSLDLGRELFDAYPAFLELNGGKLVSARNITKNFVSLEDFFFSYSKSIKHDAEMHNRVMKSLEYAKSAGLIHYGICEYVISRKYIEHEQVMNGTIKQDITVKFDNIIDI